MQEVSILSFDFAAAPKAHAATQTDYITDMQEISILSFDFVAAASSSSTPNSCLPNSCLPAQQIPGPSARSNSSLPVIAASLCELLDSQCPERNSLESTQVQETYDSQDTDNEDPNERERKIAKCMGWWEMAQYIKGVAGVLSEDLLLQSWLNCGCYRSQRYELGIDTATNVAINFAYSVVQGREFRVGITADIRHRWQRDDLDKFGNRIGYMHLGFRKMYIVHVTDTGKADLSIEKFTQDPELQKGLIGRDRSAGRMEMRMFAALEHWPGFLNKGKGNEAGTNKNGFMVTYIVVK